MEIMTVEQAAEAAKGLTFEKVWLALMESRQQMQASQQQMQVSLQRMEKDTADFKKKMDKVIGGLGNSLGQLTESMFSADLWKKFNDYGIPVSMQSVQQVFNEGNRHIAEADIYIQNGEYAIPVEVKTKLTITDVNNHLKRIRVIRKYLDVRGDRRKLIGAVAGATVSDKVLHYAWGKGLFVIVPSGESVTIADVPEDFKVREWNPPES